MTILLYKNNAGTTLQSNITAGAATAVLAAGTGALFPQPIAGQSSFFLTFRDAATEIVNEVVLVTDRAGDAITMLRAQQGSVARAWAAGDLADQLVTMGDMDGMVQPDALQKNVYGACAGGGSVNSITAQIPSGLSTIPDMMSLVVMATGANTGNVTLTLTLGSTVQAAQPVKKFGGSQLSAGDIPANGFPIQVVWSATLAAFIMTNPASGTAGSISGGALNQMLRQTAPGTTGFVPAPTIAGQVLAFVGGVIAWAAAAVTSFNGRSGAVAPQSGDYTAAQVGAVSTASVTGGNQQVANTGYQILPGGLLIQWGRSTPTTDITFPAFPRIFSLCFIVIPTGYTNDSNSGTNVQASGYQTGGPVGGFTLRAEGNERPVVWFAIGLP